MILSLGAARRLGAAVCLGAALSLWATGILGLDQSLAGFGDPAVIFIAYTIPPDAEARGYAPWLREVDMPFFNAIPGTRHYANWRLTEVQTAPAPVWDWFDFQGLAAEEVKVL